MGADGTSCYPSHFHPHTHVHEKPAPHVHKADHKHEHSHGAIHSHDDNYYYDGHSDDGSDGHVHGHDHKHNDGNIKYVCSAGKCIGEGDTPRICENQVCADVFKSTTGIPLAKCTDSWKDGCRAQFKDLSNGRTENSRGCALCPSTCGVCNGATKPRPGTVATATTPSPTGSSVTAGTPKKSPNATTAGVVNSASSLVTTITAAAVAMLLLA